MANPKPKPKNNKKRSKNDQPEKEAQSKFKQDIAGILLLAVAMFVFVANLSSATGFFGSFLVKNILRSALGVGVLVLPFFIGTYGIILLLRHEVKELALRLCGILILFIVYIAIAQLYSNNYFTELNNPYFQGAGGLVGYAIRYGLGRTVGLWGAYIVLVAAGIIGSLMLFNITVLNLMTFFKQLFALQAQTATGTLPVPIAKPVLPATVPVAPKPVPMPNPTPMPVPSSPLPPPIIISSTVTKEEKEYKERSEPYLTVHKEPKVIQEKIGVAGDYKLPPLDFLEDQTVQERRQAEEMRGEINGRKEQLEAALRNFGIGAQVVAIYQGPAVTRYELQPEPGVKVSRINALSNDISLALAAQGIRIEAPVPGKSVVGIEVPNPTITPVRLKEIALSRNFQDNPSKLAFCLGKDLSGHPIVDDIGRMPHMLIAGTTGSGKSVCLNALIVSLLLRATPEDVRFIMIDPKMVELSMYNGIAHLLAPVVTNVKKAAITLKVWVLQEMNRRYELFHGCGARDLASYNKKVKTKEERLPSIVVIVDELADLMMAAAHEVEGAICRIAQMARATGIHMVIATQRPSVDVITGLIKANIPSRVAFAVATQIDSRVIIDSSGAEKLLGRGDMLYNPIGAMKPMRLQGAFVTDHETEKIVNFIKKQCEPEYIEEINTIKAIDLDRKGEGGGLGEGEGGEEGKDALFMDVAKLIVESGQASTSYVQRKFRIGYNRAARLMDEMEAAGIVSAPEGENKPRKIIATLDSLEKLGTGQS
ncbi:MAG: DNA translocase FtsK 4TM domain-containing protein [Candidatus Margulisiibacteriota bacterium]